jgi:peptide deformylase
MAVKPIIKYPGILPQKSEPFDFEHDMLILQDMLDTAEFHKENCAGLAAIQIGVPKRVILVRQGDKFVPFINPVIIKRSPGTYCTKEGCLSLDGARTVKRHYNVMVYYTDQKGRRHTDTFADRTAQIIQHEVDHLDGVLI